MADGTYVPPHENWANLDRTIWGPLGWDQLWQRAINYDGDKVSEDQWLQGFMEAIPCTTCRGHFWSHCEKHPPDLSCRGYYMIWVFWLHTLVNIRLGKPIYPWPVKSWGEPAIKLREGLVDYSE